jgi:hypothetical protein
MRTENDSNSLTPAEVALLEFIRDSEAGYLAKTLRTVHDMALYHSEIPIEEKEKTELLHMKLLADAIAHIEKEE